MEIDSQNVDRNEIEWVVEHAAVIESDESDDGIKIVEKSACRTTTESEPDKMLDVTFYRDTVLEIIVHGLHIAREVYELRFTLFRRAVNFNPNGYCELRHLHPYPHFFYDEVKNMLRYTELSQHLSEIPTLSEINERTTLPELSWELLHWIFTNELNIEFMEVSHLSDYYTDELRYETKLMTIPAPSKRCSRFEIHHPVEINSTRVFIRHRKEFGSFFGYHGSPEHNFHSIIHRGLRCSLNVRKAYGPGTYLSSDLKTAEVHSTYYTGRMGNYPRYPHCIAIVEVIKHPSIKVVNFKNGSGMDTPEDTKFDDTSSGSSSDLKYYVVPSDDLMRLKHLLVFHS